MLHVAASFSLTFAADLLISRDSVGDLLGFLRLQGQPADVVAKWRLPITEAVNNAVIHGCHDRTGATVKLAAHVSAEWIEVSVTDPSHYAPPTGAPELDSNLLAESGRGSFIIAQATDAFEHRNDSSGHTLLLRWRPPVAPRSQLPTTADTQAELDGLALQLGDAYETVTAFAELAGVLAKCGDFAVLVREVRTRIAPTVPHEQFILRLVDSEALRLASESCGAPDGIPVSSTSSVEARVFASGQTLAFRSAQELGADDSLGHEMGPLAIIAVGDSRRRRGTLALARRAGAEPFTAGQLAFLQAVADILSTARLVNELWANREAQLRLEQEMQLAARIQQSLFPREDISLPAWNIAGACRPARHIGGDHYDFVAGPEGSCLVLMADVMGKGMPAALVATMLRSSWRALASTATSPGELLGALNRQLWQDLVTLEVFITAAILELRPDGIVRHANAGQGGILHRRTGSNAISTLECEGVPLGISANFHYANGETRTAPGDILFAFTDGCHDFDRAAGTAANLERLSELLVAATSHQPNAQAIVETALERITAQSGEEQRDDCTLLCLMRRP